MDSMYQVNVNDAFQFDFDKEHYTSLDLVLLSENRFHVLYEKKPYKGALISSNFNQKKYRVKVNNTDYDVTISNTLDILIKEMGFVVGATKQVNSIQAPMPGLILEINVTIGQSVNQNDNLLILGAMKMENSFLSPRDGVVKTIAVAIGDAVEKGQLLIEFE